MLYLLGVNITSRQALYRIKKREIKRLARGSYIDARDNPERIARQYLYRLINYLRPDSWLVGPTAISNRPVTLAGESSRYRYLYVAGPSSHDIEIATGGRGGERLVIRSLHRQRPAGAGVLIVATRTDPLGKYTIGVQPPAMAVMELLADSGTYPVLAADKLDFVVSIARRRGIGSADEFMDFLTAHGSNSVDPESRGFLAARLFLSQVPELQPPVEWTASSGVRSSYVYYHGSPAAIISYRLGEADPSRNGFSFEPLDRAGEALIRAGRAPSRSNRIVGSILPPAIASAIPDEWMRHVVGLEASSDREIIANTPRYFNNNIVVSRERGTQGKPFKIDCHESIRMADWRDKDGIFTGDTRRIPSYGPDLDVNLVKIWRNEPTTPWFSGNQRKIPVYLNPDGVLLTANQHRPWTHLLKFPGDRPDLQGITASEWLGMNLMREVGLPAAAVCLVSSQAATKMTTLQPSPPGLLVERFDIPMVNNQKAGERLLFVEACAGMGLPAADAALPSYDDIAAWIKACSSNWREDRRRLLVALAAAWMIGHNDLHARNIGMLFSGWDGERFTSARISPCYDVSCSMYAPDFPQRMVLSLHGAFTPKPADFIDFGRELGLSVSRTRGLLSLAAGALLQRGTQLYLGHEKLPRLISDHESSAAAIAGFLSVLTSRAAEMYKATALKTLNTGRTEIKSAFSLDGF